MLREDAFDPSRGVRVRAAARLTFSLIDLNGSTGRRNGVASLSICDPHFQAAVFPHSATHVSGEVVETTEYRVPILTMLDALRELLGGPAVEVCCERSIPPHIGLGSKTTILLAVAKAYAALCSASISTAELARICRRGGTSGASVNLIDRGGFLVDGGHHNPPDFYENPRAYLVPSSRAPVPERIPPVLINIPFPSWPILLIEPHGAGLSGSAELEWFHSSFPLPLAAVQEIAHLVLMNLAPSIAEGNYDAFCRTLNRITFETAYKREQLRIHTREVNQLLQSARESSVVDGIGISSQGPTCFAFSRNPKAAAAWASEQIANGIARSFKFTCAQNQPLMLEGAVRHDCTL